MEKLESDYHKKISSHLTKDVRDGFDVYKCSKTFASALISEEKMFFSDPRQPQRKVKYYFHGDILGEDEQQGQAIGQRYFFRVTPSRDFPRRYRARVKLTIEEGVTLPFLWPDDEGKQSRGHEIDYDAPGWAYPENVLDM